jgi:two-component system, NarL family, response regulator NreC
MNDKIRILLADDHAVLRAGLKLLLNEQDEYIVVGEASSGIEAIAMAEDLQPDLILLDINMPGLGGMETLPTIRQNSSESKILILTMHDEPEYLRRAIKSGASGYILKKAADTELLSAMQAVMQGEIYVHPSMTRELLVDFLPKLADEQDKDIWQSLSTREQQVLKYVALGHTSAEIAGFLSLSAKTIDTYRFRGMEKLSLKTRAALVRFALQRGLLDA